MSITVDTVQLRFHIKPDYDQQQIQQLQSDLKQSQKNIEAERKVMEKYARTLDETREKLREAVEERNKLAKQKSRTAEEMQQLGELNQTIGYLEQAQVQDYADLESIMIFNEDGICRDVSTGCMYIRVDRDPDPWEIDGQGESYWQEVDQYRDLDRADSTSTLELKITPAPMGYIGESGVEVIDLGTTDGWHDNISGTVDEETEDEDTDTDLFDSIRSFSKKETSASDLYVAFYVGTVVTYIPTGRQYPMAYTDAYHAAIQQRLHPSSRVSFNGDNISGSLRLADLDADYYQGGYQIDIAHAVTFKTFDPNHIDPRQVYVIQNRRYVVRDVEETITAEGRQPLWCVTCYPITITDEAIENRWILTRGIWDDGAAWLDEYHP